MASLSDSAGAGGGRAGAELMVPQFLLKTLHTILAVRSPTRRARTRRRPRRRRRRSGGGTGGSTCRSTRCITLLRSLYPALRFLPAYRAFRTLCASGQVYNYETGHRVGSFATPFSRAEEAAMRTKRLAPVETQLGRLVVSVQVPPQPRRLQFRGHFPRLRRHHHGLRRQPGGRAYACLPSFSHGGRRPALSAALAAPPTAGRRQRPGRTRWGNRRNSRLRRPITLRPRPRRRRLVICTRGLAVRLHQ